MANQGPHGKVAKPLALRNDHDTGVPSGWSGPLVLGKILSKGTLSGFAAHGFR